MEGSLIYKLPADQILTFWLLGLLACGKPPGLAKVSTRDIEFILKRLWRARSGNGRNQSRPRGRCSGTTLIPEQGSLAGPCLWDGVEHAPFSGVLSQGPWNGWTLMTLDSDSREKQGLKGNQRNLESRNRHQASGEQWEGETNTAITGKTLFLHDTRIPADLHHMAPRERFQGHSTLSRPPNNNSTSTRFCTAIYSFFPLKTRNPCFINPTPPTSQVPWGAISCIFNEFS